MITSPTSRILESYDEPIWLVIREPQYGVQTSGGERSDGNQEIPYSLNDIQSRVGRAHRSVLASLRRLEKRRKAKEVHGGWQRIV